MIKWIKQLFCRHDFKSESSASFTIHNKCLKCGKLNSHLERLKKVLLENNVSLVIPDFTGVYPTVCEHCLRIVNPKDHSCLQDSKHE